MSDRIPEVKISVIGGSTLHGTGFPSNCSEVDIIKKGTRYKTPFGESAPFTLARVSGKEFLFVPFHGITPDIDNTEPNSASERVFYVLWRAGVKRIIGTALCGSTNRLLDPSDVIIPDGFVDYTTKRPQSFFKSLNRRGFNESRIMYRLNEPFCPEISSLLLDGCLEQDFPRVFRRGIVGVSEGPRLESPSEIKIRYTERGIDVVTMNLVPEVYFSREIGACYAALELVSNYGEGLVSSNWEGGTSFNEFIELWGSSTSRAIIDVVKRIKPEDRSCGCGENRWPSVLH